MPIERTINYSIVSTAFHVTVAGSTQIVTGVTSRSVEVLAYWINSQSTNTVTFVSDAVALTSGGLSGFLFTADRGGAVNCGPTGTYDVNGRLVPWFSSTTSSHLYLNLLSATSVSGTLLYSLGS